MKSLDKIAAHGVVGLAVALSLFHLWQGWDGSMSATYFRPIHLSWVLALVYLHYPLAHNALRLLDFCAIGSILWAGWLTLTFDYTGIDHILYGLTFPQQVAGAVLLAATLEATRRAVGWEMALIGLIFVAYCLLGNLLPDALANRGFTPERMLRFQVFTTEGLFGAPLGIAASVVFLFVLFGAFLEVTGAGQFFINLAYAAAGKYRGGPAKAAVLASAAMGSISGSAIANAVTSGAFTIPMMKKLGYRADQAAGIEAAASTGGQIMPPIMGAGAFIMAEYTNTPYSTIIAVSFVPAALYFLGLLLFVHLMAVREGLKPMDAIAPVKETLKDGWHFIAPLVLITVLLILSFSPALVGVIGCAAILASAYLRAHTRLRIGPILEGLKAGAIMMLPISTACATAGIVVGVIGQTGLGLEFTRWVLSLADGHLWAALGLITLAALILGMGLPVTAAYILLAVMAAPALENMGIPLLVAHLLIFWLSQISNITPPVALAAFAAAGIANASPMQASIQAVKLASGFFLIPLMMVRSDLIFTDGVLLLDHLRAILATLALMAAVAFTTEGLIFCALQRIWRVLFVLAIGLLLYHDASIQWVGCALVGVGIFLNYRQSRTHHLAA